jgi:hypothetical protein
VARAGVGPVGSVPGSRPPRITPNPEEATVANKDRGQKTDKKKAQHNLKEKRAAKKTKRGAGSASSTMSPS